MAAIHLLSRSTRRPRFGQPPRFRRSASLSSPKPTFGAATRGSTPCLDLASTPGPRGTQEARPRYSTASRALLAAVKISHPLKLRPLLDFVTIRALSSSLIVIRKLDPTVPIFSRPARLLKISRLGILRIRLVTDFLSTTGAKSYRRRGNLVSIRCGPTRRPAVVHPVPRL